MTSATPVTRCHRRRPAFGDRTSITHSELTEWFEPHGIPRLHRGVHRPTSRRSGSDNKYRGFSAFEKARLMRRRRTGPEFTPSILTAGWCTGLQIPARVLVEFHALLVAVRSILHDVIEPIERPFLEIEGGPRSERHAANRGGKQSRLTNPSCFLTVAETIEALHTEGTCESRADANGRGVWSSRRVGPTFDLRKIRRRQTLSGDQMEALHCPGDRDIEQPPFLSRRIPSTHAHRLQYVRVLDLGRETEKVIAGVGDDDDVGLQSLRLMGG